MPLRKLQSSAHSYTYQQVLYATKVMCVPCSDNFVIQEWPGSLFPLLKDLIPKSIHVFTEFTLINVVSRGK